MEGRILEPGPGPLAQQLAPSPAAQGWSRTWGTVSVQKAACLSEEGAVSAVNQIPIWFLQNNSPTCTLGRRPRGGEQTDAQQQRCLNQESLPAHTFLLTGPALVPALQVAALQRMDVPAEGPCKVR